MRRRWTHPSVWIFACLAWLGLAGCAGPSKPAKVKGRQTILVTEYDDARVGREASKDVAAQIGLLEDPELNAYVNGIGRKLLRGVPRRSFNYQFAVVDQVEPNAFALPGGYIFISRGLLALANDEDELACVIGHEIVHAAARHAAAQQALAKSINPLSMPWNRAGQMAAYGRDMERDADKGGQILCAAAGYDPMGMSTFLKSLEMTERIRRGYSRGPSFFDTHPGSQERAAVNSVRAGEIRWQRDPKLGDTRVALLRKIDGLPVGQRPESGVFQGDHFIHPVLDFQISFPAGWKQLNSNQAVGAIAPRGDAVVFLMADQPEGDPEAMAQAWVEKEREQQRVEITESKPVKVGHIDAWRMRLEIGGRRGKVASYVTFIPYREATWRITGMARALAANRYLGRTLSTSRSFRPLNEKERRSVQVMRIHTATARSGESLTALGERTDNAWNAADTAHYNGLFVNHRFKGGELVKIVRVETYVPSTP